MQNELQRKLGQKIKKLRKVVGMSQEMLAEKINIDITSLSKIETGRNYPQPETLCKISNAVGVELNQLFLFEENLSAKDYVEAIYKNIDFIKNNDEKLKLLYKISCTLI